MWWGWFYLVLTLSILLVAHRRGGVAYDGAVSLLVWSVMVDLTYRYGEVETVATFIIGTLYIGWCLMLVRRWDHHWLTLYLLCSAFAMLFWNALEHHDAYLYKAVKNGIYCGMLIATGLAIWTTRTPKVREPSSDGSSVS